MYNKDEYGEVINGKDTFEAIAYKVGVDSEPVLIGWSDEHGAHLDILFVKGAAGEGPLQGGVRRSDLLVSLMRRGAFGFEIEKIDTHSGYYGEKLNWSGTDSLAKLAELIDGVKALL